MKNNNLAIAIPTYNRASILEENLLLMLEEIKKYSIPIYISDDSSNDETKIVIAKLKKKYEYIYYFKNEPGLGHDKNFKQTLQLPAENYIWYLGDSMIIKNGGIKKILQTIDVESPDFISVNVKRRRLNLSSQAYNDGNELLLDLGWHLTLSGATIYSKNISNAANKLTTDKYTNFPQVALIFEQFALEKSKLVWLNTKLIHSNKKKKSYWTSSVFEVFLNDWEKLITNLPSYYNSKNKVIVSTSHSRNTGLFNLKSLIIYRTIGIFNIQILNKYKKQLIKHSNVNLFILLIISFLPIKTLKILRKKYKKTT